MNKKNTICRFLLILLLWVLLPYPLRAQQQIPGFLNWLTENETLILNSVNSDKEILKAFFSSPFSIMPTMELAESFSERKFIQRNANIRTTVIRLSLINSTAARLSSPNLLLSLQRAMPNTWLCFSFSYVGLVFKMPFLPVLNDLFYTDVIKLSGADPAGEATIQTAVKTALQSLSDQEKRLMCKYFEIYHALYPQERETTSLAFLIRNSTSSSFASNANRVLQFVRSDKTSPVRQGGDEADVFDELLGQIGLDDAALSQKAEEQMMELSPEDKARQQELDSLFDIFN